MIWKCSITALAMTGKWPCGNDVAYHPKGRLVTTMCQITNAVDGCPSALSGLLVTTLERLINPLLSRRVGRCWPRPAEEPQRGQRPPNARRAAERTALDGVQRSCFLILLVLGPVSAQVP